MGRNRTVDACCTGVDTSGLECDRHTILTIASGPTEAAMLMHLSGRYPGVPSRCYDTGPKGS
eukprot:217908-Chlamydomonas_euryale.AAC.3